MPQHRQQTRCGACLLKLVEVEQPFFGSEAIHEIEVGLAILHAVFPLGVLVFQGKGVVGDAVLLQQDTEDFIGLLRLKNAGVLAQGPVATGQV